MTASQISDIGRLLEDVVHQDSAKSSPLSRFGHCDLPQEECGNLAVLRRTTWPAFELIHIDTAEVDRMVPKDPCTSFFYDDIDSRHVVLLLFPRAQLEVVVQSNDTTVEIAAVMPRRVK